MEAILAAGLRIPQDIAVIGCGNIRYSRMLQVPLSSIDQNAEGIGEQAATLSIQIAGSGKPMRPKAILQSPSLVARDSTQCTLKSIFSFTAYGAFVLPNLRICANRDSCSEPRQ
jgi:LacI family transcriptional regulator